jgi:hypothetical protein
LAGAAAGEALGHPRADLAEQGQHLELVHEALFGGGHGLEQHLDFAGYVVEVIHAEGHGHAALRAHRVDEQREGGAGVLEEQGFVAGACEAAYVDLGDAVYDLGDLEVGADGGADADEFAGGVERGDELLEVAVGHGKGMQHKARTTFKRK